MTVAAEVRRGWVSKPKSVEREHFKLEFKKVGSQDSKSSLTPEQQLKFSKSVWFARVGINPNGS
jgi:hypothetical protein